MADLSIPLGIPSLELITQTIDKEGNIILTVLSMSMKIVPPVLTKIVPRINKFFYII